MAALLDPVARARLFQDAGVAAGGPLVAVLSGGNVDAAVVARTLAAYLG